MARGVNNFKVEGWYLFGSITTDCPIFDSPKGLWFIFCFSHAYIHTYLPTYIHTYIHIHIYTYTYTYKCAKTCKHTYIHKKQRNKETKKQRDKETKKQRDKETKKQINKQTYIHTYIHTYICIYISRYRIDIIYQPLTKVPWSIQPYRNLRNRGTSRRSSSRPMGEESYQSVRAGNVLTARTLIIMMICHALGCFWCLEQPKGSLMEELPVFQQFLKKIPTWKHCFNMRDYGAASQKPTWLYASNLIPS